MEQKKRATGPVGDLNPINSLVPYNRRFLKITESSAASESKNKILGQIGSRVFKFIDNFREKEMSREDIVKLRKLVGHLKDTRIESYAPAKSEASTTSDPVPSSQKTKKQLLKEKRKKIEQNIKEPKKDKNLIGLRIEVERLKKRFPNDGNLTVLDAILTCRDGCLIHRTLDEQVNSLTAALKQAGSVVASRYLTTYAVDTLFDIYFLYLEALRKLFLERLRKVSESQTRADPVVVHSMRRDIRILNVLIGQKKLKKTIANITQKFNGFGYPFVSMTTSLVSKTFNAETRDENEKVGPGTVKLNKFLIRMYLNVFAQIPMLQPIARNFTEVLPENIQCRVIVANVNMDNAYTQLKISKSSKDGTVEKQIYSLYNFGKQVIDTTIKDAANNPAEAKIMLRTAEMAEEFAFLKEDVDPKIVKLGHYYATSSLSYYKNEAEAVIRRLFEVAEIRKIDLRESSE